MQITEQERLDFLKACNDLKAIIQTLHECNDIWVSSVGDLESLEYLMTKVFKFKRQSEYYMPYVLEEDDDNANV